jgi:hypothetical protein
VIPGSLALYVPGMEILGGLALPPLEILTCAQPKEREVKRKMQVSLLVFRHRTNVELGTRVGLCDVESDLEVKVSECV